MCGIAGVLNLRGEAVRPEDLTVFTDLLRHRGPDGSGTWQRGNVGLAHTRLAIIDLSPKGAQPMSNEDGTVWITYNGEVYNYLDLRRELIQKGHVFRSETDTEVIIHLYEEEGVDCLKRLRGMFAFGLWDGGRRRLLLARDRVGEKPLCYTVQNDRVVFASEPKAVVAFPGVERTVDARGLLHALSYDHIPWPMSAYRHVHKLPPASYLLFEADGRRSGGKYWGLDLSRQSRLPEQEAAEGLRELIQESVRLRLRSDVPLGMFLSGGLDSSFIVGTASQMVTQPIQTFSIGYQDEEKDDPEFAFSSLVARRFGTDHQEILFDRDSIELLPELMLHFDEPFGVPNALAHYQLCRQTRRKVTVALSGDGGDEIFGGYDSYKKLKLLDLVGRFLPLGAIPHMGNGRPPDLSRHPIWWALLRASRAERRGAGKQYFHDSLVAPLLSAEARGQLGPVDVGSILTACYRELRPRDFLNGVLFTDLVLTYAWSTTIVSDITGMSHGLEVRAPLLDHKVLEFAFSLPASLKVRGLSQEKYILYRAGESFLPEEIIRRKKMSYGAGIRYQDWFFGEWSPFVTEMLFGGTLAGLGLFDMGRVEKLYASGPKVSAQSFRLLWRLLCLSCWWRVQRDLLGSYPDVAVTGAPEPRPEP